LGRIFGKYGHYPIYYVDMLRSAMTNLPWHQKALFGARVGLVGASLAYTFNKVLGIRADSFNPLGQATFSGGPYWQIMNYGINATRPDFRGNIARGELLRQLPRVAFPGAMLIQGFEDALDHFDRGEVYKGWMRMMSIPVTDERVPPREFHLPEFVPGD
ncbi:MAG TPA: hypothetical protein VKA48_05710, partial [Gammaproteobacteria bacterium]|nr:hypothetical protein [Gammaproteobacteria bacterium]